ncbi:hypothetical protein PR048_011333 [Dryococelus australis]|uniref:Reverse transcriptase n=1 Tax=Dryococelus australis TaxID=614101 RepID=A0ABQ9HLC1_9NEOP|nr:hypothetical protein PR048_011333 [Dryococelus australis]
MIVFASSMNSVRAMGLVQAALNGIEPWLAKWRIKLNTAKTEAIVFNTKIQDPPTKLQFCGQQIECSHKVKYLGVDTITRHIHKLARELYDKILTTDNPLVRELADYCERQVWRRPRPEALIFPPTT